MKLLSWILCLTCLAQLSFAEKAKKASVKHVDAKEAKALWEAHKTSKSFVVLDVRRPSEFKAGQIPKAVNVDVLDKSFEKKMGKMDRAHAYLIHCRSGKRSQAALKKMQALGFTKIYHLDGGMIAWTAAGGAEVKAAPKS